MTKTSTKIFIEGFGNIAFGNYAIFCVWRIINGSGDLGIFGGVFQARKNMVHKVDGILGCSDPNI